MNLYTEKVDINHLQGRVNSLYAWLSENPLADIRLFEKKANELAWLSVKIAAYNKNNLK